MEPFVAGPGSMVVQDGNALYHKVNCLFQPQGPMSRAESTKKASRGVVIRGVPPDAYGYASRARTKFS